MQSHPDGWIYQLEARPLALGVWSTGIHSGTEGYERAGVEVSDILPRHPGLLQGALE